MSLLCERWSGLGSPPRCAVAFPARSFTDSGDLMYCKLFGGPHKPPDTPRGTVMPPVHPQSSCMRAAPCAVAFPTCSRAHRATLCIARCLLARTIHGGAVQCPCINTWDRNASCIDRAAAGELTAPCAVPFPARSCAHRGRPHVLQAVWWPAQAASWDCNASCTHRAAVCI